MVEDWESERKNQRRRQQQRRFREKKTYGNRLSVGSFTCEKPSNIHKSNGTHIHNKIRHFPSILYHSKRHKINVLCSFSLFHMLTHLTATEKLWPFTLQKLNHSTPHSNSLYSPSKYLKRQRQNGISYVFIWPNAVFSPFLFVSLFP